MTVEEKITHMMDEVNLLVREAFGERYQGNFSVSSEYFSETNSLETIADKGIFLFDLPLFGQKVIGKFDSKDGSSIRVLPKYASQARMYAEMFEARFGKEVKVTIDNQAHLVSSGW